MSKNLVQEHEFLDGVEHFVVLCGGQGHVVDDGGHVTEDGGVEEGGDDHHADAEHLFRVRLGGNVAKSWMEGLLYEPTSPTGMLPKLTDGCHASHGEVEGSHIHGLQGWTA